MTTIPRRCVTLLAVAITVVAGITPAAADEVDRTDARTAMSLADVEAPYVLDLSPPPGAVNRAGSTTIAATGYATAGVASLELFVDGTEVAGAVRSGSGRSVRIQASVELSPGDHIAEVAVVDANGTAFRRPWRITTSATIVYRLAGTTRLETATAISAAVNPTAGTADVALVARADAFADALAGVPLAHHLGAPLLLSHSSGLSPETAAELRRVLAPGATVLLLGGEAALSPQVARDIEALDFTVERRGGTDRYGTATAIAGDLPAAGTAILASGHGYADALAVSSPAALAGYPIVLTTPGSLPDATRTYLAAGGFERVVIVGGTAAVSDVVEGQVAALLPSGAVVDRISGTSRFETASAVAREFFPTAATVALASGTAFPDALVGARHAAANRAPVLLVPGPFLHDTADHELRSYRPSRVVIYGGAAAVGTSVPGQVRAAVLDGHDGPAIVSTDPAPGGEVNALDTVIVHFDRELELAHSTFYVTLDGREVTGITTDGDFTDTLVFQVGAITADVDVGVAYPVHVRVLSKQGSAWGHHEFSFVYRRTQVTRGDFGSEVRYVQERLTELGYWLGRPDGRYGTLTAQAVMAFEKTHGLARDGVVDSRVLALLETADRPRGRHGGGYHVEVDRRRQIMMFVRNGVSEYTFNTSTGAPGWTTPAGSFTIYRQIDGMREAPLGKLWRPKYFNQGIAMHGSTSVPAYPASHGCTRLTYAAIDFVWAAGLAPIGTPVIVY